MKKTVLSFLLIIVAAFAFPQSYTSENKKDQKTSGNPVFRWSKGGWTDPDYSVAYALADSPFGPFKRISKILYIIEGQLAKQRQTIVKPVSTGSILMIRV